MIRRILSVLLLVCMIFQQSAFAQGSLPIYSSASINPPAQDVFRPVHLRAVRYFPDSGNIELNADPGDMSDVRLGQKNFLADMFYAGLILPSSDLWVNLRPGGADNMIPDSLDNTALGGILLEADVRLKKDLSALTDPRTPQGKKYWDALYARAAKLFKDSDCEVPAISRPWIVPGEIIVRQSGSEVYIYKATLQVKLEQDYIKSARNEGLSPLTLPSGSKPDPRIQEINDYSCQLLKDGILPLLNRRVNSSKDYSSLRQAYFSLILAQWVKSNNPALAKRFISVYSPGKSQAWSKEYYFEQYRRSFEQGEYNVEERVNGPDGVTIRAYFSGGIVIPEITVLASAARSESDQQFREAASVNMRSVKYDLDPVGSAIVPQYDSVRSRAFDGGVILNDSQQNDVFKSFLKDAQLGLVFLNSAGDFNERAGQIEEGLKTGSGSKAVIVKMRHDRQVVVFVPSENMTTGDLDDASVDIKMAVGDLFGEDAEAQIRSLVAIRDPNARDISELTAGAQWNGIFSVSENTQETITDIMPQLFEAKTKLNIFYNPRYLSNDIFLGRVDIDGITFIAAASSQAMIEKMLAYINEAPRTLSIPQSSSDKMGPAQSASDSMTEPALAPAPAPASVQAQAPALMPSAVKTELKAFTKQELVEDMIMTLISGLARTREQLESKYSSAGVSQKQREDTWQELVSHSAGLVSIQNKKHNKQPVTVVQVSREGSKWLLSRQIERSRKEIRRMFVTHGNDTQLGRSDQQWQLYQKIMQEFFPKIDKKFWEEMVKQKSLEYMRNTDLVRPDARIIINEFFEVAVVLSRLPLIRFMAENGAWSSMKDFFQKSFIPEYEKTRKEMQRVNGANMPMASDIFSLFAGKIRGDRDIAVYSGYGHVYLVHTRQAALDRIIGEAVKPLVNELLSYTTDESQILRTSKRFVTIEQFTGILMSRYDELYSFIRNIDILTDLDAEQIRRLKLDDSSIAAVKDVYADLLARYILDDIYMMYHFDVRNEEQYLRSVRMRFKRDFNYPNPWRNYLLGQERENVVYFMTSDLTRLGSFLPIQPEILSATYMITASSDPADESEQGLKENARAMLKDMFGPGKKGRTLPKDFARMDSIISDLEAKKNVVKRELDYFWQTADRPSNAEDISRINYLRLFRRFLEYYGLPSDNEFLARLNVPSMLLVPASQFMEKYGDLVGAVQQISNFLLREKKIFEELGFTASQIADSLGVIPASEVKVLIEHGIPSEVVKDSIQNGYWDDVSGLTRQYDVQTLKRFFARYSESPVEGIKALERQKESAAEFSVILEQIDGQISRETDKNAKKDLQDAKQFYQKLYNNHPADVSAVYEIIELLNTSVESLFGQLKSEGISASGPQGKQLIERMMENINRQTAEHYNLSGIDVSYDMIRRVYSAGKKLRNAPAKTQVRSTNPVKEKSDFSVNEAPGEKEEYMADLERQLYSADPENKILLKSILDNYESAAKKYYDLGKYTDSAKVYSKAAHLAINAGEYERALNISESELDIRNELSALMARSPRTNSFQARNDIRRLHGYRKDAEHRVKTMRAKLQAKDGGTPGELGGIDWRMMAAGVRSKAGVSITSAKLEKIARTLKVTDLSAEWDSMTRQLSYARPDYEKLRDLSAVCFARAEGREYRRRLIALTIQLLKNIELSGEDCPPELKETILLQG